LRNRRHAMPEMSAERIRARLLSVLRLERTPDNETRLGLVIRAGTDVQPVGLTGSLKCTRTTAQPVSELSERPTGPDAEASSRQFADLHH
jgi:hypothetical protein